MKARFAGLLSPLRQQEARALFSAQLVSGLGDWAGRLALAVLVFDRSDSAWWAAAVTVVSLLPWLGPGQLLATFADRAGRVSVMIAADVARAALFAVMVIPQPFWLLLVWAFAAGLCVPPFAGSRASAMVEVVDKDKYGNALALYGVLSQFEVLVGYAAGGLVIALVGARPALMINAVTFLVSAWLLRSLRSSAAAAVNKRSAVGWAGVVAGVRVWRSDALCRRALVLYVGVTMFMILPEALVVPFTADLDLADEYVGAFAGIIAIGSIIGMVTVPTATSHAALLRTAALRSGVLALLSGLLFAAGLIPVVAGIAFIVSGSVDAIAVPTNQVVGERLPTEGRSAAMAVAGGAQYGAQIIAITAAGIVATLSTARIPLTIGMFAAAAVCFLTVVRPLSVDDQVDASVPAT